MLSLPTHDGAKAVVVLAGRLHSPFQRTKYMAKKRFGHGKAHYPGRPFLQSGTPVVSILTNATTGAAAAATDRAVASRSSPGPTRTQLSALQCTTKGRKLLHIKVLPWQVASTLLDPMLVATQHIPSSIRTSRPRSLLCTKLAPSKRGKKACGVAVRVLTTITQLLIRSTAPTARWHLRHHATRSVQAAGRDSTVGCTAAAACHRLLLAHGCCSRHWLWWSCKVIFSAAVQSRQLGLALGHQSCIDLL